MKPWYLSMTLAANAAVIGLAYWFRASEFYVDPMVFVWVVAGVNLGLRFKTRHAIGWR